MARLMKSEKMGFTEGEKLILFYRENPVVAAEDLLGIKLIWLQRIMLKAMWFKRFAMISVSRGAAKCISGDSYLFTDKGIKQIKELISTDDEVVNTDISISNGIATFKAKKAIFNGKQKTNIIETRNGFDISCTDNHRLMIMSDDGNLEWKYGNELKVGDYVVIGRGNNVFGNKYIDKDYAYLLGLLTGDGGLSRKNVTIFTNMDKDLINSYIKYSRKFFNYTPHMVKQNKSKAFEYRINSVSIRQRLINDGLKISLSKDKEFPSILLDANRDAIIAFLQGCFDTDGWITKDGKEIGLASSSKKLAKLIHLILMNLGIVSRIKFSKNDYSGSWKILITGKNIKIFNNIIKFRCNRKQKILNKCILKNKTINSNLDIIPNQNKRFARIFIDNKIMKNAGRNYLRRKINAYANSEYNISYETLANILKTIPFNKDDKNVLSFYNSNNFYFDKIVSINHGEELVYDLSMPNESGNAYLANCIVSHNSFTFEVFALLKAVLYAGIQIGFVTPSYRQTRSYMFPDMQRMAKNSPYLSKCVEEMGLSNERCIIRFKNGSFIEGLPPGNDGKNIRGRRYHVVCVDEFAHTDEQVIKEVIRPMLNVKIAGRANQYHVASTPYYKYTHMWPQYLHHIRMCMKYPKQYELVEFDYRDVNDTPTSKRMPTLPYSIDEQILNMQKSDMTEEQFKMENLARFPDDSTTFFSTKLIDFCSPRKHPGPVEIEFEGNENYDYYIGIDVARQIDNFSIAVIKDEDGIRKLIRVLTLNRKPYPEMAELIRKTVVDYKNVRGIAIGRGGGGDAIKDELAKEWFDKRTKKLHQPLLCVLGDDDRHDLMVGNRIVSMIDESGKLNNFIYTSMKKDMENSAFLMPSPRFYNYEETNPRMDEAIKEIIKTQDEFMKLQAIETSAGHKFEPPSKNDKKDRCTSVVLANYLLTEKIKSRPKNVYIPAGFWVDRGDF